MYSPLEPWKDKGFTLIARNAELCEYDNSDYACEGCPRFEQCLKWWDRFVAGSYQTPLTAQRVEKLVAQLGV